VAFSVVTQERPPTAVHSLIVGLSALSKQLTALTPEKYRAATATELRLTRYHTAAAARQLEGLLTFARGLQESGPMEQWFMGELEALRAGMTIALAEQRTALKGKGGQST
jgi:hypothetical protein